MTPRGVAATRVWSYNPGDRAQTRRKGTAVDLKIKIWMEKDGKNIMGRGRYELLTAIDETGSLADAAKKLGISYRHAWGHIKKLEQSAGIRFVDSQVGGPSGGTTSLTPEARDFLKKFETLRRDIEKYAHTRSKKLLP